MRRRAVATSRVARDAESATRALAACRARNAAAPRRRAGRRAAARGMAEVGVLVSWIASWLVPTSPRSNSPTHRPCPHLALHPPSDHTDLYWRMTMQHVD